MPLLCVWNADILSPDDVAPPVRVNNRRCLIHTDQISFATEETLASGEVYVIAQMANQTTINIFEQTLDSILAQSKGETWPLSPITHVLSSGYPKSLPTSAGQ